MDLVLRRVVFELVCELVFELVCESRASCRHGFLPCGVYWCGGRIHPV